MGRVKRKTGLENISEEDILEKLKPKIGKLETDRLYERATNFAENIGKKGKSYQRTVMSYMLTEYNAQYGKPLGRIKK